MLKGLYTAYSGMINEQNRMDVLTNNLANSATTGYKSEGATSQSFDALLAYRIKDEQDGYLGGVNIGRNNPGVKIGETYTSFEQGSFRETGNTYDLALSGEGFFTIEYTNRAGETSTMYTRDGSFTLTKEGYLVTKDGDYVLGRGSNGSSGHIQLDPTQPAVIDTEGNIIQNDTVVAQLQITDFEDYNYLEHYGENFFQPVEGAEITESSAKVQSGYLEASNVQVVREMVELISVTRQYESNQKILQAYDETLNISVNQIGKLQ